MMMSQPSTRRSRLMAGAAAMALAAAPAVAQIPPGNGALPTGGTIVVGNVTRTGTGQTGGGPTALISAPAGNNFTMNVNSRSAVIDWNVFEIGASATVTFNNANPGNPTFAVLNRVTGDGPSGIFGQLRGSANAANGGSIWVVNPNGIVFGPQSSVTNMAGFVASTLDVTSTEFANFVDSNTFAGTNPVAFAHDAGEGGLAGTIQMRANGSDNGANISGVDGVVLLVARRIELQSATNPTESAKITAGGAVGFVVARAASVRLTQDSLLQMTVTQGSDLAEGRLIAGGVVNGARVFAAVANRATLVGNLLNVSGAITATHAVATENGIVLRAGTDAGGAVPIDLPAAGAENAANAAAITGALTATGSGIDLAGASVALGPGAISAAAAITVTASAGAITSAGGTLRSNSGNADTGVTPRGIILSATTNVGTQGAGPALITGPAGNAAKLNDIDVNIGDGGAVNLGAITARGLGIDPVTPGAGGAVRLGAVNLTQGLTLNTAGLINIASLTSGATVSLTGTSVTVSNGTNLSISNAVATNGDLSITTAGTLAVTTAASATGGNLTVQAAGITLGNAVDPIAVAATGSVSVTATGATDIEIAAGNATITSNSGNVGDGARTLTLAAGGDIAAGGGTLALQAGNSAASGKAISVTPGDNASVSLTTVTGGSLTIAPAGGDGITAITVGPVQAFAGGITLQADSLTVNALAASGSIGLTTPAALALTTVRAGGGIGILGNPASVSAQRIEANGDIAITTPGALTVTGAGGLGTRAAQLNAGLTAFDGAPGQVGNVSLSAGSFAITGNSLSSTRDLSFTRTGGGALDLSIFTLTAARDLAIGNAGGLTLNSATGSYGFARNLTLTGPVTAVGAFNFTGTGAIGFNNDFSFNNSLTVAGASLDLKQVTATAGTGAVSLTSTNGALAVGNVTSLAGLNVSATGGAIITTGATIFSAVGAAGVSGSVTAGNAFTVSAGSLATVSGAVTTAGGGSYIVIADAVTVGTVGQTFSQTAAGGLLLRARTGDVTTLGNFTLEAGAGNLVVDAFGALAGGPSLRNPGRPALLLRGDNAAALTLGSVEAGSLALAVRDVVDPQTPADYSPDAGPFLTDGAITMGSVVLSDPLSIVATAGDVQLAGARSLNGSVRVEAQNGNLVLGVDAASTGTVRSGNNGDVTLQSGNGNVLVRAGIIAGTGTVLISAASANPAFGDVTLGRTGSTVNQAGASIAVTAARSITGNGALTLAGGIGLTAGALAPAPATRSINFGGTSVFTATGAPVSIIAGANFNGLTLGAITAGSFTINTAAIPLPNAINALPGDVNITSLSATSNINIKSGGDLTFTGAVSTTGNRITLDAGGDLNVGGNINARSRVVALGDAVTVRNITTGDDIVVVARIGNVTGGAGVEFRTSPGIGAPDDATAPVDGSGVLIPNLPARVRPPTSDPLMQDRSIVVKAGNTIENVQYKQSQNLSVAANLVELGDDNDAEDVSITAGRITGGDIVAVNSITLTSTGLVSGGPTPDGIFVRSLAAGTNIALTAAVDIAVQNGISSAAGSVSLTALTGQASVGGAVSTGAGQDYIVRAGTVIVGADGQSVTQSAGGGILLQSATGAITARGTLTLQSGTGQVVLDSATLINGRPTLIGGIPAARTNVLVRQGTAGAALELGDVTGLTLATAAVPVPPALIPASYSPAATGLSSGGAITLDRVTVTNALAISNSSGSIAIQTASSATGGIGISAALDLNLGLVGQSRAFTVAAPGSILRLAATRSIVGAGTLDFLAPAITLEAGGIAPTPNPPSIALGGSTVTATGLLQVLGRTAAFDGLILGNVSAGSIDVRQTGAATPGVNGPITATALNSGNGFELRSLDDGVTLGSATVTGPAQTLIVRAATGLSLGSASAAQDVQLAAASGLLDLTGTASAGRDLLLVAANGGVSAAGQLQAGRDLKADAGGDLSLAWQSGTQALQSSAGRDVVISAGRAAVRQLRAGDDAVVISRAGDLGIPGIVQTGLGEDNADALTNAAGATLIDPATGLAFGALAGRQLVLRASGNIGSGPAFPGDPIAPIVCIGSCDLRAPGSISPSDISGPGSLNMAGGAILAGVIDLGGSVTVSSTSGAIRAATIVSGDQIDLDSAIDITVLGETRGAGVQLVADRDITLGGDLSNPALSVETTALRPLLLGAGRTLDVNTGIAGDGDVTLRGGTDANPAGPPAVDVAAQDISAAGLVLIEGRRGVTAGDVTAGTTATLRTVVDAAIDDGDITAGAITARDIVVSANRGAITLSTLTAGQLVAGVLQGGTISLAATRGGGLAQASTQGDIALAGVAQANLLAVDAGRDMLITGLVAMTGNATLDAARNITTGNLGLGTGALLATTQAGNLTLGSVIGGNITATANSGKLTTGRLLGAAISLTATRTQNGGDQGDVEIVVADGRAVEQASSLRIEAGRDATLTHGLRVAGPVNLTAARTLLVGSTLVAADTAIDASGDVVLGAGSAEVRGLILAPARGVTITADTVTTAAVTAGTIDIIGGASVNTGRLSASDIDVRATAGPVTIASIADSGTVLVQASASTRIGDITSTGAVTARAGQVGETPGAGSGNLQVGNVDTGNAAITLRANNGTLTTGSLAGGAIDLAASGAAGDISLDQVLRASSLTARAGGMITANADIDIAGSLDLDAGTSINLLAITNAASLLANAGTTIIANNLNVAGEIRLTGGTGVTILDAQSTGNGPIAITATTGTLQTGNLQGGAISLTATAGAANIGSVTRASSLSVEAGTTIDIGEVDIAGGASLDAGTSLTMAGVTNAASLLGLAGTTLTANGNLNVAGAIQLTGGTGVTILDAESTGNGPITITATTGTLQTGNLQGGAIALTATAGAANIGSVTRASSLSVESGTTIDIGEIDIAGGASLDAGTVLTMAVVTNAGSLLGLAGTTLTASGNLNVVGAIQLTGGTGITILDAVSTGNGPITLTATNGTLQTGNLQGGVITLSAAAGNASIGSVTRAGELLVTSGSDIDIGDIDIDGAATLDAGGNLTMASVTNAAELNATAGTNLTATGTINTAAAIALLGGTGVTTQTVNSSASAAVTATATTGNLQMGSVSGGAITLAARAGNAAIGGVSRGTILGLSASGAASSSGPVVVSGAASITGATVQTANVSAGSITMTGAGSVTTGTLSSGGAIDVRATAGTLNVAGITSSGSVLAQASGNATLGNIGSSGAVIVRSGQIGETSGAGTGNLVVGAIDAGSGAITLRANTGTLVAGSLAGGAVNLAASGTTGDITLAGISRSSGLIAAAGRNISANGNVRVAGTATITTSRLDLGSGAELRTDGRFLLRATTGSGDVNVANGATSLFDDADMARVFAPVVQVDGNGRNLVIGTATLFPNVLRVGFSTTANITVTGALRFESAAAPAEPRTLTLGGDATATDNSRSDEMVNSTANVMATRVVVETTPALTAGSATTGGQLIAGGSVVRVRGSFVALGMREGGRFLDTLLGTTPLPAIEVRTRFTELPTSTFYLSIPTYAQTATQPPIVTASRLVLGVGQWGLVQNTGQSAQPGGGVALGSIQLVNLGGAAAPQGGPIVGFFGSLGGQEGIAAALRVTVDQLGGITPNNVRINGCVALTTAGCIVTGLPLPLVQLNDPGRALLIRSPPELVLPLELISGTTNEALWRDDEDLAPATAPVAPPTQSSTTQGDRP